MIDTGSRFFLTKDIDTVNRSVRHLVSSACRHMPFYRDAFEKAGIKPSDIRSVDDLPALPVTHRTDLMSSGPSSYLNRNADPGRLTIKHTTGTTGTPVMVYMNYWEQAFRKITLLAAFRRNVRLTFPLTILEVGPERKDDSTAVFQRIGPAKLIRLFRNMPMDEQIAILKRSRPTLIKGRPSTLWQLALALQEQGIRPPSPRLIFTGAEMLFSHVRLLLQDVFNCRVVDYYNCEEVGNLAWQCPDHADRMHPNTATGWLEAVGPDGQPVAQGREGRLVVTNLYNHTMPFIRYALGDRGVLLGSHSCSCGFTGPVMHLTEGRDENFIVLPDGREITPRLMYDVVNSAFPHDQPGWNLIDHIRTFQIIQEAFDLITVKVVCGPAYSDGIWQNVRKNICRLHQAMKLQVVCVRDLSPPPGKKFHQVLSGANTRWKSERNRDGVATDWQI